MIGVALVVPLEFTVSASILPSESASPMARLASQFGGIPGLGGVGSKSMVELYPQITRSQTVLTGMLDGEEIGPEAVGWVKYRGRKRES